MARRDYSQVELTQKLAVKKFDRNDIDQVIAELLQQGYLDDTKFLFEYIAMRRRNGFGPVRIKYELQQKGLSEELLTQLNPRDEQWYEEAFKLWQRHFRHKIPKIYSEKVKQMRYLQYRGFTTEHIEYVFKNG